MPYNDKEKFYLAVDCVIFGFDGEVLKLLLYKRDFEPEIGKWSLMGGFLRSNETLDAAAYRILARITGLRNIYMEQLITFSDIDRDREARVVSTAYFSLIKIEDYDIDVLKKYNVEWFDINNIPDLIFDHAEMVDKGLKRLNRRATSQPIGFELLPEQFTITQLRNLYEGIYQRQLDPANFRRKFMSMDLLKRLPIKDMNSSRKGSFLYSFDKEKYEDLMSKGFSFDVTGI
jgi:8-oxo-dGTP diphosphatase